MAGKVSYTLRLPEVFDQEKSVKWHELKLHVSVVYSSENATVLTYQNNISS